MTNHTRTDDPIRTAWLTELELFEEYQLAAHLSSKTILNRAECLLLLSRLSGQTPEAVTRRDVLRMMARSHARSGEPLSAGTRQAERSYLRAFFGWMRSEGRREDDPSEALPKVKVPRSRPRPLRLDQVENMLDSGAYRRTREMITIAALTSLRIGEIVRIRGEDFDAIAMTISVRRKGGYRQAVHLTGAALEIADAMPRSGWWFPSPYKNNQFPGGDGHILMKSASTSIGKAIRRAGIVDVRLTGHSLRHFYATTLVKEGVPIRVVQELLGHASLATTQIYTLVDDEQEREAITHLPTIELRASATRRRAA